MCLHDASSDKHTGEIYVESSRFYCILFALSISVFPIYNPWPSALFNEIFLLEDKKAILM